MLGQGVTLGKALGGLWVSSMGLNRSKSMSGEFPNKVPSSTSKAKEKQQGLVSQDPTHSSSTTPDCSVFKKTRKSLRSIVEDQPGKSTEFLPTGSKEKRKKQLIPKIIITPASSDENSSSELEEKEQKTIRDQTDYGPYYRHRNPSTIEAYQVDPRDK
ncbi:spermatogenesis-associated protein 33 isoform X1 [Ornithorhynchus anatinus]|uniref:spermatogenesis-associated protein 33 isoform X1 n=1 Tax=Ornithorhynchus anatinus TaxID=9258 RepID=UPI0010A7B285|nr:spermatogenesis-associated protein 33 isoform X1 [Ornithorhynchus anatinus]